MAVFKLENTIQNYAWGSRTAMPGLLGYENPDNEPMAELWMGAHPKAPSLLVKEDGTEVELNRYIENSPDQILGRKLNRTFAGRLPFLFKVLAAGSPLSIQAHPNLEQAAEGFRRENEAGIAPDAFNRNYKDNNHKPEIICALTEYHAMRGFRAPGEIAVNFRKILIPELDAALTALESVAASPAGGSGDSLKAAASSAIKVFFTELMRLPEGAKQSLIDKAVDAADSGTVPEGNWIKRFSGLYPGDVGIVSPLYLNVVVLKPGEAMFLPAGELHAYLEGLGMELMANSDNVLRGGLTPKHVDVPELLSTLTFSSGKPGKLTPVLISDAESAYMTDAPEFFLSRIELNGSYKLPETAYGPELPSIFICLEGTAQLRDSSDGGSVVSLSRGRTAFCNRRQQTYP